MNKHYVKDKYMSVIDIIGNTPLVDLKNIWDQEKTGVRILAKLEGANPGGSVKDRPALNMLQTAIDEKILTKEKIILEPTSGNTGIGMAMIAAALGYNIKLIMPECVSQERRAVLGALGADLELTPGNEKTDGAIKRAHEIMDGNGDHYFMPNQFDNDANWQAHFKSTAPEVIEATNKEIDYFVAGMGTSGTLMGCTRYFNKYYPSIKIIGVEPELNHRIQGLKNMKEAIVPKIYKPELLNDKITSPDEDAFTIVRKLAQEEGVFCGISSGAAMWGAMQLAQDLPRGTTIVVIFPDRGDRYLSTELFRSFCASCPP